MKLVQTLLCLSFLLGHSHAQFGSSQQGFGQGQGQQGFGQGQGQQGFGQGQGQGQQGFGQGQGISQGQGQQGFGQGQGDPFGAMTKALYCFSGKNLYSSCAESYRLTEQGELHVPPENTDQFCEGPCQEETSLVLDCIEGVMANFLFYNKATTQDVRQAIAGGCSQGQTRGDFDVAKYVEHDEGDARRVVATPVMVGMTMIVAGWVILGI